MAYRLALCIEYPIRAHGGTEVLVRALIRGLAPTMGVVLVSHDDTAELKETEIGGLLHAHIHWNPEHHERFDIQSLVEKLKAQKVDLAHFHFGGNYGWNNRRINGCPLLAVAQAGIPCVTTNHGVFALLDGYCADVRPIWMKLLLLPMAWLAKMQTLWHTRREIAVSMHDLRNLQNWYRPFAGKFGLIYHSQLNALEVRSKNVVREKTVICVGTIGHRKGQAILARAFGQVASHFPEWRLILAGKKAVASLVAEIEQVQSQPGMNGRIEMVENLSDEAITHLLQTSSIFAMPSLREGLGLSLQEALWHGCPAIGSRVGGIPELIDHESNGLLVPPGDESALASGLTRLMSDESIRTRMGNSGQNSILQKGMTSQAMLSQYRALYSDVLAV